VLGFPASGRQKKQNDLQELQRSSDEINNQQEEIEGRVDDFCGKTWEAIGERDTRLKLRVIGVSEGNNKVLVVYQRGKKGGGSTQEICRGKREGDQNNQLRD